MSAGKAEVTHPRLTRVHCQHLLKQMIRIRRFEEKCAELYTQEKIRGFLHLYIGEEAVAAGVMDALTDDDAVLATYREHGHALARGLLSSDVRPRKRFDFVGLVDNSWCMLSQCPT